MILGRLQVKLPGSTFPDLVTLLQVDLSPDQVNFIPAISSRNLVF